MLSAIASWDLALNNSIASLGWPVEGLLRLMLAALLGGVIGLERELRGRRAGFRTFLLVCLGSTLAMVVSIQFAVHHWTPQTANQGVNINVDPAHIAYGVIVGIGFLGAGTIINSRGEVHGLTTAAAMWCTASIGLALGFGMYTIALFAALQVLAALWLLEYAEYNLPRTRYRSITVRTVYQPGCVKAAVEHFESIGLRVLDASFQRDGDLSHAQIDLRIGFPSSISYYSIENRLEKSTVYDLIRAGES